MSFKKEEGDPFSALSEVTANEIIKSENAGAAFFELEKNFLPIIEMIKEMGRIKAVSYQLIPSKILSEAYNYALEIRDIVDRIIDYDIADDVKHGAGNRQTILREANQITNRLLEGSLGNYAVRFLDVYAVIKSFDDNNIINIRTQLSSLIAEVNLKAEELNKSTETFEILSTRANDLLESFGKKSTEDLTEEYGNIFEEQANKHQASAIAWLIIFVLALSAFVYVLPQIDNYLPVPDSPNTSVVTIGYIRHLLVVSFALFVLTFLLKQYGIQKHLQTLNTHRKNVFNSFKLFVGSLSNADVDVRHSLMVEVAKAIADANQTGYINVKDDNSNSAVTEITKYLKKD